MTTKIEWTDETWNPSTGCTRVSEGCRHCYIERTPPMRIHGRTFEHDGIGASTKGGVELHPDRLQTPLSWKKPRRIFVNSMSDLFHPDVPDTFIAEVFATMARAPQHTFQVLTKRPRRMADLFRGELYDRVVEFIEEPNEKAEWTLPMGRLTWPLPNVWLGTSVENQEWADKRIPLLLETPAAVRFLSCEPLLGPIDVGAAFSSNPLQLIPFGIHWVIAGGESGPGARPMHPTWARSLRDQCVAAGVPFFFKQWGEHVVEDQSPQDIVLPSQAFYLLGDPGPAFYRVGKKKAGRELDGRTWDEMPDV